MVIQDQQGTGDFEYMSKKSCVIYDSWGHLIANLPDEMAGQLVKQIITYAFDMTQPPIENPAINAMFEMVKTKLDEDAEKYQAKVDRLKNNTERNRDDIETISEQEQNDIGGVSESVSVYESDKDIEKENKQRKRFIKPSVEEVREYCQERQNNVDPETFVDFYESKGWKVGSNAMKDWKSAVRTWEKRSEKPVGNKSSPLSNMSTDKHAKIHNFSGERKNDYEALFSELANR